MAWVAVVGAGVALVGTAVSANNAKKANQTAKEGQAAAAAQSAIADDRIQRQLDALDSYVPPDLLQYIKPYAQAVAQGQLTPEEATFKMQEASAAEGIRIPEELLSVQRNVLSKMTQIADEGGITAIDRARLNDIRDEQAYRSKGEQEAITQNAQQRGVAGSGLELASRLVSQQQGANRAAKSGTDVAAEAQRRALEATIAAGNQAGAQRTQSLNEQAKIAEARDAINQFNTSFANKTDAANVAARNAAQAANLQEAQRISEYNIGQSEREAAARAGAAQSNWTNTMNLGTTRANLAAGQATNAQSAVNAANTLAGQQNQLAASQNAAAVQQLGSAAGKLVGAYDTYQENQKKKNADGTEG